MRQSQFFSNSSNQTRRRTISPFFMKVCGKKKALKTAVISIIQEPAAFRLMWNIMVWIRSYRKRWGFIVLRLRLQLRFHQYDAAPCDSGSANIVSLFYYFLAVPEMAGWYRPGTVLHTIYSHWHTSIVMEQIWGLLYWIA
jgi:hypothetical protein